MVTRTLPGGESIQAKGIFTQSDLPGRFILREVTNPLRDLREKQQFVINDMSTTNRYVRVMF